MPEKKNIITPDHDKLNNLIFQCNLAKGKDQKIKAKECVHVFTTGDFKTNRTNFYESGQKLVKFCSKDDQDKIVILMMQKYFFVLEQNQFKNDFDIKVKEILCNTVNADSNLSITLLTEMDKYYQDNSNTISQKCLQAITSISNKIFSPYFPKEAQNLASDMYFKYRSIRPTNKK